MPINLILLFFGFTCFLTVLGLLIWQIIIQDSKDKNRNITITTLSIFIAGIVVITMSVYGMSNKTQGPYVSIPIKKLAHLAKDIKFS